MPLENGKEYIFDSYRVVFSAFASESDRFTFDTDWVSDIDFTRAPEEQFYTNPSIMNGYFSYANTFPLATSYQDIPTALEGYRCNLILIANQNYHAPVTDQGEFLGYETGSLSVNTTQISFPGSWPLRAETVMKGNAASSDLGYFGNGYDRSFTGNGVTAETVTTSAITRGYVTYDSGPIKFTNYPINQYMLSVSMSPQPVNVNQAYFQFDFSLNPNDFTVSVRHTPYEQTSVKRIYFTNSSTAIVFYKYAGIDYKQVLVKGTGDIWYGLGDGYISKALIFDDYAWVYIYGSKYLCRSIGGCLNVY